MGPWVTPEYREVLQINEEELFLVFFGARYPARQKTLSEKNQYKGAAHVRAVMQKSGTHPAQGAV